MAGKSWFLTAARLDGWRLIHEVPVGAANSTDGWVIAKTGSANTSSAYYAAVKRAASTFVGLTAPDGSLDLVNFDALRTQLAYSGSFASGTWTFTFVFRPTSADSQQVAAMLRLFKGQNVDGSGATEITTAQQLGGTTAALSSTSADYTSQVSFNPGAFSVTNEYLFVQLALKRVVLGNNPNRDCVFRTGSSASVGTRIVSADFTSTPQSASAAEGGATASDATSVVSMGYGVGVAEGAAFAVDTCACTSAMPAAVAEGGSSAYDTCDASVVAGTPLYGRVAWIRMIAPRTASQSASVIEGGPTAQDACDAKFAIAASINEGGPTAQDSVQGAAVFACAVAEGSPIAFDTAVETANVVTYATIEEVGAGHDDIFSQFDPATAFAREGADTALDLCEASVVQPSAVAEAGNAQDTCTAFIGQTVLAFEGGDTAQDSVSCGVSFDVSVAEGGPSATDLPSMEGAVLAEASVDEGEDTAQDFVDAAGIARNASIEEGDDTAADLVAAFVEWAVAVAEGDDTAADEQDASAGWYVEVNEGGDTANDLIACDVGERHVERTRLYLPAGTPPTYLVPELARQVIEEARSRIDVEVARTRKVDDTTREVAVVSDAAPDRLFDKEE